jgi:hypothetical protein
MFELVAVLDGRLGKVDFLEQSDVFCYLFLVLPLPHLTIQGPFAHVIASS